MKVSELITIDTIRTWKTNDTITIKAGTGAGKSYFIKNILYAFAEKEHKKILFLIHRINCVNQFKQEIIEDKKTNTIDIMTYQEIEWNNINKTNKTIDFNQYSYIVCDEFHYFMSDAAFNKTTDISLNLILMQANTIKIFMSATGNYTKNYIKNIKQIDTIDYELPIEFNFIKELTFFNKDETMESFVEEAITKQTKVIFFIESAKKAFELYNKYKEYCLFNCSKHNKGYYKHVDKDKINSMLVNQCFNELILITTTCMDAGVNIIDLKLHNIVCDVEDIGTLIQCIGRKRIQNKDDYIYLYIKTINNQQLGGKETQLKRKLKKADYLREHTVKEYIEAFPRDPDYSNIVYDNIVTEENKGTKTINELMYFKCRLDICDIQTMKTYGKFGYCKFLANMFNFINDNGKYNYRLIEENWRELKLEEYLNRIVGQKLFKDEQKELINEVGLIDARGRLQKSIGQLNAYFEENKLYYIILSKTTKDENRKNIRFWEVNKLSE